MDGGKIGTDHDHVWLLLWLIVHCLPGCMGSNLSKLFLKRGRRVLSSWEGGVFARVQAFNVKLLKIKRRDLIYIRVFLPPLPSLISLVLLGQEHWQGLKPKERRRGNAACVLVCEKNLIFFHLVIAFDPLHHNRSLCNCKWMRTTETTEQNNNNKTEKKRVSHRLFNVSEMPI